MNSEDILKTTFLVENGHYEYVMMWFGLKNAPTIFQRGMDNLFKGIYSEFVLIHLDRIIIKSASKQEHIVHLTKVFQRLRRPTSRYNLTNQNFCVEKLLILNMSLLK